MAWKFEDERTPYTQKILELMGKGVEALVPSIWPVEVSNALLVAERRKRVTEADVTAFLHWFDQFSILVDSSEISRIFREVIHHARTWKLTLYDAMYLDLALRHELPLATLDEPLKKAALTAGISLA